MLMMANSSMVKYKTANLGADWLFYMRQPTAFTTMYKTNRR